MVGRGGNSRNWLSPLFMLIHYSMAKYDNRSLRGEKNPAWKDRDFEKISQMFAEGKGITDIAKSLGISKHIVQKSIQLKFKELWQGRK